MVSVSKTRVIYGFCVPKKIYLMFICPKQEWFMVSVSKTRVIYGFCIQNKSDYGFCIQNKSDLWFLYAKQE